MAAFIVRRVLYMIPTLLAVSMLSFVIIQLPPGDFLTSYAAQLRQQGDIIDETQLDSLRERYGFGQPVYVQYFKWITGIVTRGDWGQSFEWQKPVKELIWERLWLTVAVSLSALLVSWFVAIPIGVYSATHQYSWLDYILTTLSFIGLGTPGFLIGIGCALCGAGTIGDQRQRSLFRAIHAGSVELGKVHGHALAHLGSHANCGRQQHSRQHPHHSRQFA